MIEKFWDYMIMFLAVGWVIEGCQSNELDKANLSVCNDKPICCKDVPKNVENSGYITVNKGKLVEAFIHVESKGDDTAVNRVSKATGCLQIMPIMVHEANRIAGYKKYNMADRNKRNMSVMIFHEIMRKHNPKYDITKAAKLWNPSGGSRYYNKIHTKYNELMKGEI